MIISVKTFWGWLSAGPSIDGSKVNFEYKPTKGDYEEFEIPDEIVEEFAKMVASYIVSSVVIPPPVTIPPVNTPPMYRSGIDNPRNWFMSLVGDKPFRQDTLTMLEPFLNQNGWMLTPPNSVGDRTKVHPPDGVWTRVGFGEGHWVWIPQSET